MSVTPKVIETAQISAVAKDGIELMVKTRVTVRTNIDRLIGGAGEDTILARIGAGTAFEIISIDIADIDIGRNVGAHLLSLKAEADNKIAQAKAEERRAMAVALEQEMNADVFCRQKGNHFCND